MPVNGGGLGAIDASEVLFVSHSRGRLREEQADSESGVARERVSCSG